MVRYDYKRSIRMSNEVRDSLEKICEVYKVNEPDCVRLSLEKTLYADMLTKGLQTILQLHINKLRRILKKV